MTLPADHPELWHISAYELSFRIFISIVLGGIIGLERERGQHPAGFRTHILVCVGSALITLTSIYGFAQFAYETNVRMDPARLAAQIVSGIGFLGAGTIMRHGGNVSGLTTAASLWVVAAIGIGTGAGFYYASALTTIIVFVSLFALNIMEKKWLSAGRREEYSIQLAEDRDIEPLLRLLSEERIAIHSMTVERSGGSAGVRIHFIVKNGKRGIREKMASLLAGRPGLLNVEVNRSVSP
ncbi:MgtC/SapB family protein [Cohnella fermenti]|uniref:MgtC/SapB family protein n=1 Tax=Cohnella fermenti TaxID=2565925 RepID=A0A4S4BL71_9BACL|nr:MgtC/SapB family protein [Cohnella fermenti]THF75496.1 MgtC/SapB family protein [Cohnella fermenti]